MFENYRERKQKNLASLIKIGDVIVLSVKRFSPETGEKISDDLVHLNIDSLKQTKEQLQKHIADIDELLADIENISK